MTDHQEQDAGFNPKKNLYTSEEVEKLLTQKDKEKDAAVLAAKIEFFNRLWEASVGKTQDNDEGMLLLMIELRTIRKELEALNPSKKEGSDEQP